MVKRTSHKKHASKTDGSITTSKKPTLHLSFPILDTSKDQSGSLSKVSEAAAIASAPELSNLLQSIQNSGQQKLVSHITSPLVNKGIVSPSSSTTITTTTALTLSRFLASSGFFRTGALVKAKDMSSDDLESPTFKSCFGAFADGTALEQSRYSDETSTKQQSQILVRTGTSSAPFSIPLTFTMASKVLKSAPLLRVTGSNGDESHIQHLATSAPGSSLPLITTTSSSTSQLSTSVSTSAILLSSSISHPSFNSLSPITSSIVSSSGVSMSPALLGKSLPATGMETHSPGASIINIGTDTVFMKETSQSITSVPCTVSIDLGQIATAVSSNVMKLTAAPKISLIPTVKQVPVSGLTERLLLTGPTVGCQPSIATLPSLSHSQFSEFGKLTSVSSAMTNARPSILVSTDSPKTLNTNVLSTSVLTVSSSQLLSTLSSNTALIALKLSTPSANTITSEREMSRKDVADKQTNDIFLAQLKGNLNLQSQSSDHTKVLNTSTQPGENTNYQQNLQIVNSTGSINFSPSTASLIITSGNKLGTGQIVLHCQRAASSSPQSPVIKPHSPLLCVSTASETLGQVTSLLESSPVAVGDKQKPQTPEFGNPSSSSKDVELSSAYLSSSSSSSSSYVNQVQTTPKSNKTMASSYSTTSKQVLPTIASTRTRRIKTPKQYDL
uniref:Uncharacterized protein n=2 Tax=Arion vulgaris TaxID=1028688 RepID=A0A0B6ZSG9_9EUPU